MEPRFDSPEIPVVQRALDRIGVTAGLSLLAAYGSAVSRDADRLGLVSRSGVEHFLSRHVAESLLFAAVATPEAGARWADLGSGAGLPGIPLACVFPDTRFVLVESQQRRAGFLEVLVEDLGLDNVEVVAARAEKLGRVADVAVTRAFSSEPAAGASMPTFAILEALTGADGLAIVQAADNADPVPGCREARISLAGIEPDPRFLIMGPDLAG